MNVSDINCRNENNRTTVPVINIVINKGEDSKSVEPKMFRFLSFINVI